MTWCVCVMHLRFSKPMDKCTPRTRRITWWPVCRQKWPWNWTPSPSILCIQEPTLHCREWHRCSDLQGRTPHHAISFDFAARYDGRWMSSNHFFIKLTISHSGQPLVDMSSKMGFQQPMAFTEGLSTTKNYNDYHLKWVGSYLISQFPCFHMFSICKVVTHSDVSWFIIRINYLHRYRHRWGERERGREREREKRYTTTIDIDVWLFLVTIDVYVYIYTHKETDK